MSQPFDIELSVLSQPRYLCVIRAAISAAVERIGFPDSECGKIMLAVDEAVTNIIRHGYNGREDGRIDLRFTPIEDDPDQAAFRIVIEDEGEQIDPNAIKGRDLDDIRPGGLGVHIIREVMDDVTYTPRPEGGMRVEMTKSIVRADSSKGAGVIDPPGAA